jgi:hypothetical protein
MRAEEEGHINQRVGVSAVERIVIINVYAAVLALVAWWAFFTGHA